MVGDTVKPIKERNAQYVNYLGLCEITKISPSGYVWIKSLSLNTNIEYGGYYPWRFVLCDKNGDEVEPNPFEYVIGRK